MNISKKERSERMKKAWATRKKNLKAAYGGTAVSELEDIKAPIKLQIPSQEIVTEVADIVNKEFFDYLVFARSHRDPGILNSEKFNILEKIVKENLGYK